MKKLGVTVVVCFLSAALAACQSGQPEVTATAAGAICTYEDGRWDDCGDPGSGGGAGGDSGNLTCPSGNAPACVACMGTTCVAACRGGFTCRTTVSSCSITYSCDS